VCSSDLISFNLIKADFLFSADVYVFYRTSPPDTATVQEVQEILQQSNIDASQLEHNPAEHCQVVESVANSTYLLG
jgi:hypothetical protein